MSAAGKLLLSVFPGVDLLGRGFEEAGYCVVRGPDPLWGGDIRHFHPPAGHFWGVFGGSPCQDFSSLRRSDVTGQGLEMIGEFLRVVRDTAVEWWLLENVARVPDIECEGYQVQRLDCDLKWWCDATRLRHIHFGSRSGRLLHIDRSSSHGRCDSAGSVTDQAAAVTHRALPGAATANDPRTFSEICRLQGLPADFDLPPFTVDGKKRAVGNGVPLPMGRALAAAITEAYRRDPPDLQLRLDGPPEVAGRCACGCGRRVTAAKTYYDETCRKRAQRRRDRAQSRTRAWP